jgi:PAS domain S-box-containing protein
MGELRTPGPDVEQRFRLMFERSADAILLLDTSTNRFVEYNQAALDMLRCTREELRELHPSELSPPTQPDGGPSFERANQMIATALARGSHRFEWVHKSPHRPDFPVEVLLTPIQAGAEPILLVVWRDITERRQNEEAVRQAQKLESLGVLASGIAHDFNNLLAVIAGNLALVQRTLPRSHQASEYLGQMESAVFRAAELTRQMLAYGGKGAVVIEPIDLSRAVREISDLLRVSIPRRVEMVSLLAAALPAVRADRAQLQQVVMNLVTNAAEAIGDAQGRISLETLTRDLDAAWVARELPGQDVAAGRYVVLRVTDTGRGMAPDVLARIFDPFFTTKQAGRGLGLSALRGIVRSHHGGLRIQSTPGRGTTFEVYLPASELSVSPSPPPASPPVPDRAVRVTALLVDDEPQVRDAMRRLLEAMQVTVLEAEDGEGAVALFRAHRERITFVLLDLTMPGMGGRAAWEALRAIDPAVKVVFCSGWAQSEVVASIGAPRPPPFLGKPFTDAQLHRALSSLGVELPALR